MPNSFLECEEEADVLDTIMKAGGDHRASHSARVHVQPTIQDVVLAHEPGPFRVHRREGFAVAAARADAIFRGMEKAWGLIQGRYVKQYPVISS